MSMRDKFDISKYFVVGPENTRGRDFEEIVKIAVEEGFRTVQVRSKISSAREMIELTRNAADGIRELGKENEVCLLVDDYLDVVLAARDLGIKVDGIHVGQNDIPVATCRKYLGENSVIGLSARTDELIDYVKNLDVSDIDYFGAGPLHPTETKPDCGLTKDGSIRIRSLEEIRELAKISPLPVTLGGGVKEKDLKELAATGIGGFFVVSAIAGADDPRAAARALSKSWDKYKGYENNENL